LRLSILEREIAVQSLCAVQRRNDSQITSPVLCEAWNGYHNPLEAILHGVPKYVLEYPTGLEQLCLVTEEEALDVLHVVVIAFLLVYP
jgi:hypothetical protein